MSPAEAHAAAVEAATSALDDAMEGWGQRMAGEAYAPSAEAAIRAYLAALKQAGYRVVPASPTPDQALAGETAVENNIDQTSDSYSTYDVYDTMVLATEAWKAMHDAAPAFPPEGA